MKNRHTPSQMSFSVGVVSKSLWKFRMRCPNAGRRSCNDVALKTTLCYVLKGEDLIFNNNILLKKREKSSLNKRRNLIVK